MDITEQNSRECLNPCDGEQNMLTIDRLSSLPDSLLHHILSFLPTKLSVATSVLATRWRFLWAHVPTLDFDGENKDIIDRLMFAEHNVNTFRLSGCYSEDVETWIAAAVGRNAQNFDLFLPPTGILPPCLFTCETLVYLRLESCGLIAMDVAVCLPRLKKLHLISVRFGSDDSLGRLLSGCPVLEELLVGFMLDRDLVCWNISSPTTKKLTLHFQFDPLVSQAKCLLSSLFSNIRSYSHDYRVEINTPALRYLHIVDRLSENIKFGQQISLYEADICLHNDNKKEDDFLYSLSVLEFVENLYSVKFLKFDLLYCTKIIGSAFSGWTPSFHNLTKLELTSDCWFLIKFLENADNLEILIFWEVCEDMKEWMEPQRVPTCLLLHLRSIMVVDIVGTKHDFEIVRYLLSNAQVLERMEIAYHPFFDSEERLYVRQEISKIQQGSKACQLAFVDVL